MAERIVPDRFLDAGEEPHQALTPIEGYEKVPLVPLNEAIKPIKSLLHNADLMVEISKRNSRKPTDGLTQDESAAIHLYTMQWPKPHPSLFTLLNEKLRSQTRETLISWFPFLKLFFTALHKLPSYKGTIFRGVRGNLLDQYDEDHIWWGASSCTETMEVLKTFIGNEGDRTLFTIECVNGKAIRAHSYFKKENEILLMPGSYFKVVSKWSPNKGLYMIQLRESKAPYETISSPFDAASSFPEKLSIVTEKKDVSSSAIASASSQEKSNSSSNNDYSNKWKQYAITVAGGYGDGNKLNQLSCPHGIYVDDNHNIYVADWGNHRIVKWEYGEENGEIVARRNAQGNRINSLDHPTDMIIDKQNNSFIISDIKNRRVIYWSCQKNRIEQIIISNIHCLGLAKDKDENLYVSDYKRNEVRRWRNDGQIGTIVAGGNGRGNNLNQLNSPTSIFVNEDYSIYVSDNGNHRVMKWVKDGSGGIIVAGGNGEGNRLGQLSSPFGVVVDQFNNIYVADSNNHRVMRWSEGDAEGTIAVGGNSEGKESYQLSNPIGLSFDAEGNLYVSDSLNHRIQKFEIE